MDNQDNVQKLKIELDEAVVGGEYANLAIVSHTPTEFVLDFATALPGITKAKVRSRIIMSPTHAKNLMRILADNVKKYESKFGEVKSPKNPGSAFVEKVMKDKLPN